jgi:hypothetical protein
MGVIYAGLASMYQNAIAGIGDLPVGQLLTSLERFHLTFWRVATVAVLIGGCAAFATLTNSSTRRLSLAAAIWGVAHAAAHLALALALTWWVVRHPASRWATPALYAMVIVAGGMGGATIVGVYLTLSDRLFAWHQDHVFAVQSIIDYRNFVRMHLAPDGNLTLYPIGVRRVPRKWRSRLHRDDDCDAYYEPVDDVVRPHLIEGPITVRPVQLDAAAFGTARRAAVAVMPHE